MPNSLTVTPHVVVAGSEPWVAAAVKLWLTRGEGMRVHIVDAVPTRRAQLPRNLHDMSVVVLPRQYWSSRVQELLNASFFPGIPIIVTSDERELSRRSSSRDNAPDTQVFPFHLHPKSVERLPHLIRELHEVSQKRRVLWDTGRPQFGEQTQELSEKELQILSLVARGYSNWAIAKELKVSEKSMEAKLTSIYEKLRQQTDAKQVNSRVAAALHFYGLNYAGGGVNRLCDHPTMLGLVHKVPRKCFRKLERYEFPLSLTVGQLNFCSCGQEANRRTRLAAFAHGSA